MIARNLYESRKYNVFIVVRRCQLIQLHDAFYFYKSAYARLARKYILGVMRGCY